MIRCQRRELKPKRLAVPTLWNQHWKPDPLTSNWAACFLLYHHQGDSSAPSWSGIKGAVVRVADLIVHLHANPILPPSSEGSHLIINTTPLSRTKYHPVTFTKESGTSKSFSRRFMAAMRVMASPVSILLTFRCRMKSLPLQVKNILTSPLREANHRHRPFSQNFQGQQTTSPFLMVQINVQNT